MVDETYKAMMAGFVTPPSVQYDDRNNPYWDLLLPVRVMRMDHSIAMSAHAGTLLNGEKPVANVASAMGGFVFIVHPMIYKGEGMGSFALDCKRAIEFIYSYIPELAKAKEFPAVVGPLRSTKKGKTGPRRKKK